jgi:Rieske Fe-S protein
VAAVVFAIPFVGYLLGVRPRKTEWVPLGEAESYPTGETRMVTFDNPLRAPWDGMAAHTGVYVRREASEDGSEPKFLVLAVNCAHLGCPVSWFPQSGLFMCPCHGGVYYENGDRASGPPPRGMFHCTWRVRRGQLEVQAPHYPSLQDTLDQPATEAHA